MSQTINNTPTSLEGKPLVNAFRRAAPVIGLWLFLRLLFSVWIAGWSLQHPQVELAQKAGLWPPSAPFSFLKRVLLIPWLHWDVEYFLNIATRGYRADDGTSQFHPLYPMLGRVVGLLLGGNMLLGLLVVGSLCALLLMIYFEQLARLDLPAETARRAVLYLVHAPVAFILFAPYTESLFLLCSVLTLLMARRGRWWMAGMMGSLAVLTRQQGVFLLVPLAWELWEFGGRKPKALLRNWRHAMSLTLVPLAMLGWLIYRALTLSDVVFDLSQPRTLIYGLLISKSASAVVPRQDFMLPWQAIWNALNHLSITTAIDLGTGCVFLPLLILGGRFLWRLRPSYFLYSLVIILVSFSYSTGRVWPYMGLPRHCLLAFPLFLPLAVWGRHRFVHLLVLAYGLSGLLILTVFYNLENYWLP
jgi:hypothetical protein